MRPAKNIRPPLRALWLAGVLALAPFAHAHDPGLSTATLRIERDKVAAVLVLSPADAGTILNLDKIRAGWKPGQELEFVATAVPAGLPGPMQMQINGQPVTATDLRCTFDTANNLTVLFSFPRPAAGKMVVRSTWLPLLPAGHRQYFTIQNAARETLAEHLFSAREDTASFELSAATPVAPPAPRTETFADFLAMGVKHIWTGYDHLLFLFALLVVTRDFKAAIKIITCFTVAHSLTLAVATLNLVQISSGIVEPLIAASIVYAGLENIFSRGEPKGRAWLTFAFGLIHGFGFATVLRELGVGANGGSLAVPLISFNLGVELGQIAVAALVLPLIWKWRTRPGFAHRWVPAASTALTLLGGFWFVQRVWF